MAINATFDTITLLTGAMIFFARVVDVSLGTLRTISIVQGRTHAAFCLGFVEITVWLAVITTVVNKVIGTPVLAIFYALGFATGNVVGILLERRLIAGPIVLRIISSNNHDGLADYLLQTGHKIITFNGYDDKGSVKEFNVFCRRRNLKELTTQVKRLDRSAIYITEQAGGMEKILRPTMQKLTGWRAPLKRK